MDYFEEYMKGFDFTDLAIAREYNHSRRIADLCEKLALLLNLEDKDVKLARMCGLYHNVGKFPEIKFNYFGKYRNVYDHGDMGYFIFEEKIAPYAKISREDKLNIGSVIMYHNKKEVPTFTNEKLNVMTKIVRDALKIDLFKRLMNDKAIDNYDYSISDECNEEFLNMELIDDDNIHNMNDQILKYFAMIWDVNYDETLRNISNNGYVDNVYELVNQDIFKEYYESIKAYMEDRIWKQNMTLKRQK